MDEHGNISYGTGLIAFEIPDNLLCRDYYSQEALIVNRFNFKVILWECWILDIEEKYF